uniref:perilipin-3-like n=1 Tax=Myxine glutinosa TaxID=7769 RepID=UPI00358E279D
MAAEVNTSVDNKSQSVVHRLSSLPLLSSAVGELVQVYKHGKESRPILRCLGNVAEQGIVGVAAIASTGIKPIARILHPQIEFVDKLACRGLDVVEAKVPILHLPANKVLADTKEHVSITLQSTRNQVGLFLNRTKSQVRVGVKLSKQVVLGGTDTLLNTRVGRAVLCGADSVLTQVDRFLPLDEPEGESHDEKAVEPCSSSVTFYHRLVSVSSKAGREMYKKSAAGIQHVASGGRALVSGALSLSTRRLS